MKFEDYRRHDAIGLAKLVAQTRGDAGRVARQPRWRASAEVNPTLNALIRDLKREARAAIDGGLPDGPAERRAVSDQGHQRAT